MAAGRAHSFGGSSGHRGQKTPSGEGASRFSYASYALVFARWRASLTYGVPFPCRLVSTGRRRVSSHAVYGGMRVCCVASAGDASRRARLTGKVRKVPSIICPVGRKFSRCHRSGPTCFGGRTAAYGSVQGTFPDAGKFFLDMPGSGFAPAGDREMFHYPADLKILPPYGCGGCVAGGRLVGNIKADVVPVAERKEFRSGSGQDAQARIEGRQISLRNRTVRPAGIAGTKRKGRRPQWPTPCTEETDSLREVVEKASGSGGEPVSSPARWLSVVTASC